MVNDAKPFESFVNSEECKTEKEVLYTFSPFESFVNSEECKTNLYHQRSFHSLRALLIQKSVKQTILMKRLV